MFGFKKKASDEESLQKCWEEVKRLYQPFLPANLFASEEYGEEGKLFALVNIYPVLRFICVEHQDTLFKERILTDKDALTFYNQLDHDVVSTAIKKWREKNIPVVVDAILEKEGLLGKNIATETLRRQQLTISLSKDSELLTKRSAIEQKFLPTYIRRAIEADFKEILDLELSRTRHTRNKA